MDNGLQRALRFRIQKRSALAGLLIGFPIAMALGTGTLHGASGPTPAAVSPNDMDSGLTGVSAPHEARRINAIDAANAAAAAAANTRNLAAPGLSQAQRDAAIDEGAKVASSERDGVTALASTAQR